MNRSIFIRYLFITVLAIRCGFQAHAQFSELPKDNEAPYAADTTDLFLQRQEAILNRARVDLAATGWRRLLPSVRFGLTFSNRSLLFSPVGPSGDANASDASVSDTDASLWQLAGNWTLSLSLPAGNLLDTTPRRRARAAVRVAEANWDWAVHQRTQAQREATLRHKRQLLDAEHLILLLEMLNKKRLIEEDLLQLALLKYEQGELSFEGLAAAKLGLLELERQIAVATHNLKMAQLALEGTP